MKHKYMYLESRTISDVKHTLVLRDGTSNELSDMKLFVLMLSMLPIGFFDQNGVADMIKESVKMYGFKHPHVLNIIGVCVDAGPAPYIVMPFMANGSLLAYIRKEKLKLVVPVDNEDNELASVFSPSLVFQILFVEALVLRTLHNISL